MARHFYNVLYDYQDDMQAIKGTTEADKKKKADLKIKMNESADQLILYSQAASDLYSAKPTMKAGERGNYKVVNGYLSTAYDVKGIRQKRMSTGRNQKQITKISKPPKGVFFFSKPGKGFTLSNSFNKPNNPY
jgi:hypothetical protein